MSRLKWFFDKLVDIAVAVIAGYLLYLVVGGYISQPLSEISPHLPTLFTVSLVLAIVGVFLYRTFQSIKFHRFVERKSRDLTDFLNKWDKLYDEFVKIIDSRKKSIKEFEDIRAWLLINYPKISAVKFVRYGYVDRVLGISIRDYDVIGNLIMKSPFTRMEWFNVKFARKDFEEQWDTGRSVLVTTIGYFQKYRSSPIHFLYWLLHLISFPEIKKSNSTEGAKE